MKTRLVHIRIFTALAALLVAADAVTPVEKVTSLLEDLKKSVEDEAAKEAETYGKFACFCKDTTKTKSETITEAQDKIDTTTADIGEKSATKQSKITKHGQEQQKVEETTLKLQESTETHQKELAAYEGTKADLTKALVSIRKALKSLKDSKGTALLSLDDKSDVSSLLELGEAMGLVQPSKQQAVSTFLQRVDPKDPAYKFHSAKILEIMESLQKDFQDKKESLMSEWEKTDNAFKAEKKEMQDKISTAKKEIQALSGEIDKLSAEIAKHKEDLVTADATLQDDSAYLRDLTARCEEKARDWDQRSSMRNDEVKALSEALQILTDKVKDADKVNKRALLLAKAAPVKPSKVTKAPATPAKKQASAAQTKAPKARSFLEEAEKKMGFLSRVARVEMSSARGQDSVIELLHHEGIRLKSVVLSSLVNQIRADPFGKVKKLIQGLIERLLNESKQEATKKGFCDTELGKSKQARNARFAEINKIDAEVSSLEASQDALEAEIEELTGSVESLNKDLQKASDLRAEEKSENEGTIKTAREGVDAVGEALTILKDFYKSAGKAAVLLQGSASPVDEDDPGAGFKGSYKGSQEGSQAILGLLETIKSDFERTVRKTEDAEDKAHDEFVEFQRTSKADISGKETKIALDKQDLESTKNAIAQGHQDMKTSQDLLDAALKNIEDLKPTCIDTGMSYQERVQKREDEISALKKALCMLDGDKVEAECQ